MPTKARSGSNGTHDVVITNAAGVTRGLMLARSGGKALWSAGAAPVLPGRFATTEASYANFPADVELPWSQSNWRGGMGQKELEDPSAFWYSEGLYSRTTGKLHLGPKPFPVAGIGIGARWMVSFTERLVADISSSSVASPTVVTTGAAHGLATGDSVTIDGHSGSTPALDGVYTVTVTGATTFTVPVAITVAGSGGVVRKNATAYDYVARDNLLYRLDTAGTLGTLVTAFPKSVTHLYVYEEYLLAAQGDESPHYYSTNGVDWTQSAVSNATGSLFFERSALGGTGESTLWKARGNVLRSSTNPTVSWSAPVTIGSESSDILALYLQNNVFLQQKEDGLYSYDGTRVTEVYREKAFAGALQAGLVHNNLLIFPERYNLVGYTINAELIDAGFDRFGGGSAPITGQVWQMAEDQFFTYAALEGNDGNWYVLIGERLPNGQLAWDVLVNNGLERCTMVYVSDLYGDNRRLYFGRGNEVAYVILSRFNGDMLEDPNCRFINRGVLYSSTTAMGFAAAKKSFDRWQVTRESMAAGLSVAIRYRVDGGAWVEAGLQEGVSEADFLATREANGIHLQYQIELRSDDDTATPVVRAAVHRARLRIERLQQFQFTVRVVDHVTNRRGQADEAGPTLAAFLRELRDDARPCYLYDRFGTGWRVHVLDTPEVEVVEAAGKEPELAMQVTAIAYDQHVPGILYNTGHLYNKGDLYARKAS